MKQTIALGLLALSANLYSQDKPNILLFLVDDMGWQDTSVPFWDQPTPLNETYETPNMEKLASSGMKFSHAYACPVSSPSRVSLMTGANVAQHKVSNWTLHKDTPTDKKSEKLDFEPWNYNGISPTPDYPYAFYAKCLPEILKENGYLTMIVGKAHFGAIGTPSADPLSIGFDINIGGHAAGAMGSYLGEDNYGTANPVWGVPHLEKYHGTNTFLTEALTQEATALIDSAEIKQQPFFLYMSHYAVHAPFAADMRFYNKYIEKGLSEREARYASLIEGMDKSLGDLMNYLEEKGIANNTIILFMSDNGGYNVNRKDKNYPLYGGKGSLFEGGVREPMIVYWPDVTPKNTTTQCPVIIEDFFPTILEMAKINDYKTPQTIDGKSFVATLKNEKTTPIRPLYFHYPNAWGEQFDNIGNPQSAIIYDNWKLIHDYEIETSYLFNLKEDISEQHNLYNLPEYKQIAQQLEDNLTQYLRTNKATMPIRK